MFKRALTFLIAIAFVSSAIFASTDGTEAEVDAIFSADIPISYGEESFRERILKRTNGERDPIGLVLTGGSARAFAHLGVIKYLEENNIEPDFIIGNSMGSIIGMLYAAGLTSNQIMQVVNSAELSTYFKLTAPVDGGLLDPSGFKGLIEAATGRDLMLEDLDIPLMVICEDLVTKREIRMMEGSFSDVMMAAFALPVYFPPVEYNGHLLIDGGVVNLAPISVAYEYSDTVIVSTTFYDNENLNLKNPITLLNSAFDIGKKKRAAADLRKYADDFIWIRCAVEQFSFMEFSAAEEMAKIGYESAMKCADKLGALHKTEKTQKQLEMEPIFDARIKKIRLNLECFNRIEQAAPSNILSIGVHSFQGKEYPYYLRDSLDIGLEYGWKYRKLELALFGGGAFDTISKVDRSSHWSFSGIMDYYPVSQFRLSAYGAMSFNDRDEEWYVPSFYLRQGADYKIVRTSWFSLSGSEALEWANHHGKDDRDALLFTTLVMSNLDFGAIGDFEVSTGYMGLQSFYAHEFRNYFNIDLNARTYVMKSGFYFDYGLMSRVALDGKDGVPLFNSDGFVTSSRELLSIGYAADGGFGNGYIIMLPFSFGYSLKSNPTFGELLIFEHCEASVYCDLLWYDDTATPGVSTGVELQFALALIGLQKLPMTFRVGYDSVSEEAVFSLRFAITDR